jgi:hypothetical protein
MKGMWIDIDYGLLFLFLLIGVAKLVLGQYDTAVWVFLSCALLGVSMAKDKLLVVYEEMARSWEVANEKGS